MSVRSIFFLAAIILLPAGLNSLSAQIKPYKAKEIEIYKSKPVLPAGSKTESGSKAGEIKNGSANNSSPAAEQLFGVWRTRIPGGVWQTPSGIAGYDNLHVSAGAKSGDLIIRKDGTYKWNSYGGKEGRWEKGNSDYPIVLIDNVEHKKWKVGIDPKHTGGRDIVIWDGNYWYDGKK
jgi:hypothetical protein